MEKTNEVNYKLAAKGRLMDADGHVNPYGKIDGAVLASYNEGVVTIRIDDSHVPGAWVEVSLPIRQFDLWMLNQDDDSQ